MKNWGTEEWSAASVYSFIAFGLCTGNAVYRDPAVGLIAAALLIIFVYSILNYVGAKNKEIEGYGPKWMSFVTRRKPNITRRKPNIKRKLR